MTTWFVTRHPGAVEWAARQGVQVDQHVAHLNTTDIAPGDIVIGILPVHLAAQVCARGGRYFNLSIRMPVDARGRELTADELEAFDTSIEEYAITAAPSGDAALRSHHNLPDRP